MSTEGKVIKAISKTEDELRVGNYMALFGGKDLEGEHFTKSTNFESTYTKQGKLAVDWEHRAGRKLDGEGAPGSDEVLGFVDWKTAKIDKIGLWVERVLDRRNEYMKYLEILIENGLISNSTEALPEQVKTAQDGEITAWPLYRDTLTVMPMEPRMMTDNVISAVKGLHIMPETVDEEWTPESRRALQERALEVLDEIEVMQEQAQAKKISDSVDQALIERAFSRQPTRTENLYEDAALGCLSFFANSEIKSLPVRVMDYMPEAVGDGLTLLGRYDHDDQGSPRIILSSHYGQEGGYKTLLHEIGHALDLCDKGDEYYDSEYVASGAREDTADEYRKLLKATAWNRASVLFHGGSPQLKSMPVDELLLALGSLGS